MTNISEQSPVPTNWPKRIGIPSPGIVRTVAYPAGGPPDPNHPRPTVDAIYPKRALAIAKAHAELFPGKRIQVGKRIFREAVDPSPSALLSRAEYLAMKHGPSHPRTVAAIRAATPHAERLLPNEMKRMRVLLGKSVSGQLSKDLERKGSWVQTASVDVDLRRCLAESLLRLRSSGR